MVDVGKCGMSANAMCTESVSALAILERPLPHTTAAAGAKSGGKRARTFAAASCTISALSGSLTPDPGPGPGADRASGTESHAFVRVADV